MLDFSVDDPSDWPSEFIGLKQFDSLLRCSICLEFFKIAMIIPCCSHNYCSLCIRKHITYKECCPTCNSPLVGGDLKCNRILDELVKNFKAIREHLLDVLKLYTEHGFTRKTLNKHRDKDKAVRDDAADEFQFEELPVFREPNSSQNKSRLESKKHCRKDSNETEMTSCPVCSKKVSLQKINIHLDTCLEDDENSRNASTDGPSTSSRVTQSTKKKQRESVSPTVKSIMKPIVLVTNLNALQDKELKSKVGQYGLSLQGNRKQLMKRIEQYILLHNSQCDALNPMSLSMIAKEVSKNERNLLVHGYTPSIVAGTHDRSCSSQEKVDFSIEYAKKYEGQYQKLIGEVKGRQQNLKRSTRDQNKGVVSNQSVNNNNNNNNNDELIEICDSDPTDKEAEETTDHSAFGYVPTWFDTDLLKGVDKKVSHTNVDLVKSSVDEKVAADKGIKRKSKKTKSAVKKKIIQSGNIASYFAGSKKEVKPSTSKNNDTMCRTKLTNKDNTCIFLVDDSDEQSENDKSRNSSSQKCPPPMNTTEDLDGELMPDSPSMLETEMTENVPELAEELESDVGDALNSTAFVEPDPDSLFINDDLSPVLFKECSPKHNIPCHSRSRIRCSSASSMDSQLSLEINNLVDKAVEKRQTFSSDSEGDYSFEKSNLIPVKRILHNDNTMRREVCEKENNPESQNVIPVPPSDFCFSQADF